MFGSLYSILIKYQLCCQASNAGTDVFCVCVCVCVCAGADWPLGEPGEFPVAWQPIWPAALHFFIFFYNLLLLFYIVVFVAYRMY